MEKKEPNWMGVGMTSVALMFSLAEVYTGAIRGVWGICIVLFCAAMFVLSLAITIRRTMRQKGN